MDDKALQTLLHQLDEEIKHTHVVDEQDGVLLRNLEEDIHTLLTRAESDSVSLHPSYVQHLQTALGNFEVTHPSLTELISKLLESLSNVGI